MAGEDIKDIVSKFEKLSHEEKMEVIDRLISKLNETITVTTRHRAWVVALDRAILENFDMALAQYVRLALSALAASYLEGGEAEANRLLAYLEKKARKQADKMFSPKKKRGE